MTTGANPGLIKTYDAEATVAPYRIVKFGAADYGVVQGAAAADLLIGVSNIIGAENAGDPCDVVKSGIAKVEYGGTITRGAALTTNASGQAVAAVATNQVIGYAEISGVSGDIGAVMIAPHKI